MNTKAIFLLFILQSQDHIIHYVTKSIYKRYKRYVKYKDIKKETILHFNSLNIQYPLNNKDPQLKKLFSSVAKYGREERKNFMIHYSDYEYQYQLLSQSFEINDDISDFHKLDPKEKNICNYLEKGYPTLDILMLEKLSFQQFQKIKKNCKRKLLQNSQKDVCNDLKNYFA